MTTNLGAILHSNIAGFASEHRICPRLFRGVPLRAGDADSIHILKCSSEGILWSKCLTRKNTETESDSVGIAKSKNLSVGGANSKKLKLEREREPSATS